MDPQRTSQSQQKEMLKESEMVKSRGRENKICDDDDDDDDYDDGGGGDVIYKVQNVRCGLNDCEHD